MRGTGVGVRLITAAALMAAGAQLNAQNFEPCKNNFSAAQQIALGDKAKAQVYQQTPVLPDDSPVSRYVQQLGQRLVAVAPGYHWPYNFHVANNAEINAFALPGGSVFVNLGTIQAAEDEAQLAGVMAHEISHVVLQHSVCNAEKQQRIGLFAGLGQIAASVILGQTAGDIAAQGIGMTAGLGFLRMSREAERQADLEGARIAYDAGFDPHGMTQFFRTIENKYGSGGAQFLSDHPNPGNRSVYVDQEIATFPPQQHPIRDSAAFERIAKQISGMHAYTSKEIASGAWKMQAPNQTVGNGLNQSVSSAPAKPDLSSSGAWKTLQGTGFTASIPAKWKTYKTDSGRMAGPDGGIGRSADGGAGNVVYGMLTDRYQAQGNAQGAAAVIALIDEISRDNPGFSIRSENQIVVNGVPASSVECVNPSANGGKGERDWIVAFQLSGTTLRYFVFVAPSPDFDALKPAFQRIVNSIRLQQ